MTREDELEKAEDAVYAANIRLAHAQARQLAAALDVAAATAAWRAARSALGALTLDRDSDEGGA